MSDKKLVNAALDNLAEAVKHCLLFDIITPEMILNVVDGEFGKSRPKAPAVANDGDKNKENGETTPQ